MFFRSELRVGTHTGAVRSPQICDQSIVTGTTTEQSMSPMRRQNATATPGMLTLQTSEPDATVAGVLGERWLDFRPTPTHFHV